MDPENIYVSLIVFLFCFIIFILYMNVRYSCCN
jgi:hypothetical protein